MLTARFKFGLQKKMQIENECVCVSDCLIGMCLPQCRLVSSHISVKKMQTTEDKLMFRFQKWYVRHFWSDGPRLVTLMDQLKEPAPRCDRRTKSCKLLLSQRAAVFEIFQKTRQIELGVTWPLPQNPFNFPSKTYVLKILAWNLFFALSNLAAENQACDKITARGAGLLIKFTEKRLLIFVSQKAQLKLVDLSDERDIGLPQRFKITMKPSLKQKKLLTLRHLTQTPHLLLTCWSGDTKREKKVHLSFVVSESCQISEDETRLR